MATIAMLVFGMYVGSRRELLWTLRDRAERAEAEQGLRVEQGQLNERTRIAREMREQVGRTAYRIVQEGLTNVRKHAPGVTVLLHVSGSPSEGLSIRISNPARSAHPVNGAAPPGAGLGLVGLTERAKVGRWSADDAARRRIVRAVGVVAVEAVSGASTIRVLVVDDDALVRSGLVMILGGAPDIEVVDQAVDGRDGVDAARRHRPDVVLMDIRMPRLDGLEATELIGSWAEPPKVIVLTTFDTDDYVVRALGAGASGFLLKDTAPAAIIDAIRKVADGDPMLSPRSPSACTMRDWSDSGPEPPVAGDETATSPGFPGAPGRHPGMEVRGP